MSVWPVQPVTSIHKNDKPLDAIGLCKEIPVSKVLLKWNANSTFGKEGNVTRTGGKKLHGKEDKIKFNAKVPCADGIA